MRRKASRRLLQKVDKTLDVVLHPLMLAPYAIAYNCFVLMPGGRLMQMKVMLVIGFLLMTAIFPAVIGLLMKRAHAVTAFWHTYRQKDRRSLLLVDLIFYTSVLSLSNTVHLPMPLKIIPLASIILILVLLIASFFTYRIDSHYAALGVLIAHIYLLGALFNLPVTPAIVVLLLLTGLKSAVQVERHKLKVSNLLWSLLLGWAVVILSLLLFLR